jgi:hypothetical protein
MNVISFFFHRFFPFSSFVIRGFSLWLDLVISQQPRGRGNAMQRMTAKVVGMPADVLSGRRGRPILQGAQQSSRCSD